MSIHRADESDVPSHEHALVEMVERVRQGHDTGTVLRILGGDTKAFFGRDIEGSRLSIAGYRGVVSYEPTELVVTARAGTRMSDLEALLAEQGQMFGFEPPHFGTDATLGGTVSAGLSGPRRPYGGSVRDAVLGVRCLTAAGEVLRFGAQVMKNVAGFDVSRLLCGAFGTLAILLEVSVKVLPRPSSEITLTGAMGIDQAIPLMNRWARSPLPLSGAVCDGQALWVRLSGERRALEQARAAMGPLDQVPETGFWEAVREQRLPFFRDDRPLWRISLPPATPALALPGDWLVDWGGAQRWLKTDAGAEEVRRSAAQVRGYAVLFRGGDQFGEVFPPLPDGLGGLHARLKQAFDPRRILNRGRYVWGSLMQTSLAAHLKDTPAGREADAILRSCVHCGLCTASCPTYRLLGDELDGPRGRIYLIKSLLEGHEAGRTTQVHLDRCLGCRACETACPSGVEYARLLDIGRTHIERLSPRPLGERLKRFLLCRVLPYPRRVRPLLRTAQLIRPLVPPALRRHIPEHSPPAVWPVPRHARRALLFEGCVQPLLAPGINAAAARLLDRLGIGVLPAQGCCGAMSHHLAAEAQTHEHMRRNIDAWWPRIQAGAETLIVTASGCGTMIKDYGRLLRHDPHYADRAERVSRITRDLSEVVAAEAPPAPAVGAPRRIAFHSPCSLTHGQGLAGVTESLLSRLGFELTPVADPGLCCGSAGTYSILQPALSRPMLRAKVAALEAGHPDLIATANIGCYAYLRQEARVPVVHWVELLG